MSEAKIPGSCLCGEVSFQITKPYVWFHYCHCSRCRKVSGSAHSSNLLIKADQLEWTMGEASLGRYELPEAKSFSTTFCTVCGSSLPWVTKNGRWVVVPVGALDVDPGALPERNIFWDSRAPWYAPPDDLPTFAEIPPRD